MELDMSINDNDNDNKFNSRQYEKLSIFLFFYI